MQSNLLNFLKKILSVILSPSKDDNNTTSYTLRLSQCNNSTVSFPVYIPLFLVIIFTSSAICQIENLKWQKENISYEKPDQYRKRNYSFQSDNAGEFIKKSFVNTYWFFISDVDGDNCAFQPTCSSFFIDAIEGTNIFQGTLMFSDRLIRDTNPFKINAYPWDKRGYYYDPAYNYTLNQGRIKYLPPTFVVDDE
jgi:putative component of membrane protein insertase Oxa1/YidC/SpoIIIJ protein YidD